MKTIRLDRFQSSTKELEQRCLAKIAEHGGRIAAAVEASNGPDFAYQLAWAMDAAVAGYEQRHYARLNAKLAELIQQNEMARRGDQIDGVPVPPVDEATAMLDYVNACIEDLTSSILSESPGNSSTGAFHRAGHAAECQAKRNARNELRRLRLYLGV